MADGHLIMVPPGRVKVALPWPSSIWLSPVMVIICLCEGMISWKYFLSRRMVCDVALSIMHTSISSRLGGGFTICISGMISGDSR